MRTSKGFTLIELVVVIVILGILAATAAPKFMDLQKDARISAINGLKGVVKSAVNMGYAKAVLVGSDKARYAQGSKTLTSLGTDCNTVVDDMKKVCTVYGNPSAKKSGIVSLLQFDSNITDTETQKGTSCDGNEWCIYYGDNTVVFAPQNSAGYASTDDASCALVYKLEEDATNKNSKVTTSVLDGGC